MARKMQIQGQRSLVNLDWGGLFLFGDSNVTATTFLLRLLLLLPVTVT